jgi:hypothetical protein
MTGFAIAQMTQLALTANLTWLIPGTIGDSETIPQVAALTVAAVALGYFARYQGMGIGLVVGSAQLLACSISFLVARKPATYMENASDSALFGIPVLALTLLANRAVGNGVLLPAMVIINPAKTALCAAVTALATTYFVYQMGERSYTNRYHYVPMLFAAITAAATALILPRSAIAIGLAIGVGTKIFQDVQVESLI